MYKSSQINSRKIPSISSRYGSYVCKKLQQDTVIRRIPKQTCERDFKFETEEQIEIQQICNKVSKREVKPKQKSSYNLKRMRQSSASSVVGRPKSKQMGFYYCDSITIRPNKIVEAPDTAIAQEKQNFSSAETQSQILSDKQGFQSIDPRKQNKRQARLCIFSKTKLNGKQNALPFELMPYQPNKPKHFKNPSQEDEPHITIQLTQITQFCI